MILMRATPSYPSGFQGLPLPQSPSKWRDPSHRAKALLVVRTKTLNFSFFPLEPSEWLSLKAWTEMEERRGEKGIFNASPGICPNVADFENWEEDLRSEELVGVFSLCFWRPNLYSSSWVEWKAQIDFTFILFVCCLLKTQLHSFYFRNCEKF